MALSLDDQVEVLRRRINQNAGPMFQPGGTIDVLTAEVQRLRELEHELLKRTIEGMVNLSLTKAECLEYSLMSQCRMEGSLGMTWELSASGIAVRR